LEIVNIEIDVASRGRVSKPGADNTLNECNDLRHDLRNTDHLGRFENIELSHIGVVVILPEGSEFLEY
jgi:hypothetical protein